MQINLLPGQFLALEEKLSVQQGIIITETGTNSGTIANSDVTLSYVYDGDSVLDVEIIAKHSWKAKIANDNQINQHIRDLIIKAI